MKNSRKPKFLSLCSGKGGVGKSVLTSNLAYLLSKKMKVLIWDGDLFFPNQHLIFGIEPPIRASEVYSGRVSLDRAIQNIGENLFILADSPANENNELIKPSRLYDIYEDIIKLDQFDIVLIDTPAGGTYELLQLAAIADILAVIITDEPTSLLDSYALIKIMLQFTSADRIKLIVNNVIDDEDAEEVKGKMKIVTENFLKFNPEYLGYIPYDRLVRQSIVKQELLSKYNTDSEVTDSLIGLCDNICKIINNEVK